MSAIPLSAAGRNETLGLSGGDSVTITSGTANTKGSYVNIGTAGFAYNGLFLRAFNLPNQRSRIDVAIDNGGTRTVIAGDIYRDGGVTDCCFHCPIQVPAGSVLDVRWQTASGSQSAQFSIMGYALDTPGEAGHSRIVSCTDFTNTQPTNIVTQNGTSPTASWTEIVSALPCPISMVWFHSTAAGDASRTACAYEVEVAVGAAGSEQSLCKFPGRQSAAAVSMSPHPVPCYLPAGARLSFKVTCSAAAADSFGVAAWGLAA